MSQDIIVEEEGVFEPENDLDEHSKASYLEHISYRLKLPECIRCTKGSGLLNSDELRIMAEAIIKFDRNVDISNIKERTDFLNEIRENEQGRSDFSFVNRREWSKYSKTQLGMIIAATLKFQFDGDPHIGRNNGNIYIRFYEDIYDKLPDPEEWKDGMELNKESIDEFMIERNEEDWMQEKRVMSAPELYNLLKDQSEKGITVPEYQRSDQQWPTIKKQSMVKSMIRDIPMPSIILGKTRERPTLPWQLVDGHQRLSTIKRFMGELDPEHFQYMDFDYEDLPVYAKKRFDEYEFIIEWVIANDDKALAQLYTLYNNSGKKMTPVQIRVAKWHEISGLHHLLLALSGGPILKERDEVKERLGIKDAIDDMTLRAGALRKLLPGRGSPTPDEKDQLRQVTEKTYDNYCKTVAYCLYRYSTHRTNETPTAEAAVTHIFSQKHRPGKALKIAKKLDFIIRNIATIYGDYAFLTHRSINAEDEQGNETTTYELGKALNSWAMQVQAGGLWDLNDKEITILNHNPDDFQSSWREFNIKEMVDVRQNSKTLWRAQEKWTNEVKNLVDEYRKNEFDNDESPKKNELVGVSLILKKLTGSNAKEEFIDALRHSYSEFEVEFIIEQSKLDNERS